MDKNQATGLLLIFLILTTYFLFFAPQPEPTENTKMSKDDTSSTHTAETIIKAQEQNINLKDSAEVQKAFGNFSQLAKGKEKEIVLENEDTKIVFTSKGGKVKSVLLKGYTTSDKKPLILLNEKSSTMSLTVKTKEGKEIDLYQLFYTAKVQGKNKVVFQAKLADNQYIEQVYQLDKEGFKIDYDLKLKGLEQKISGKSATFYWVDNLRRQESDLYYSRYYSTVNYSTSKGDYNYLHWPSESQHEQLDKKIHWISFKQKYFNSGFISKNKDFSKVRISADTPLQDSSIVKTTQAYLEIPLGDLEGGKGNFNFYFGPNKFYTLKALNIENYHKNVHLGVTLFSWISRYIVIPLFSFLEANISSYGLIIIVMVLIIKTVLFPLTYKSYKSMARMKIMNEFLKPELDAFKEKNGLTGTLSMEDQQKVNQEQMRLYGELGSSPFAAMSGCIPMLLQMPIFIALFIFFPHAIELRQQSFLWAHDLSTYDSILNFPFTIPFYGDHVSLFTLLMTLSTISVTYFTNQTQANLQGPMKYMGYMFPVIFMFVLNSYPAGLSFYYLVQNVVTISQQQTIKKFFINEEKIKAKFEEYKKNNKHKGTKKSKWQVAMEDAKKKAQEKSKQQKDKAKKK